MRTITQPAKISFIGGDGTHSNIGTNGIQLVCRPIDYLIKSNVECIVIRGPIERLVY